jgi:cytochrome c peroxidase
MISIGVACSKTNEAVAEPPYTPHPITFVKPLNFPQPAYDFTKNPLTREGVELGRKLFYDGRLSRDGTISCGTCHKQEAAFSDPGLAVSKGIDNKLGLRNTPAIMNAAWDTSFFWDGSVTDLDKQPVKPIENPVEMDEHMPIVLEKLKKVPEYKNMFRLAFGSSEITEANLLKALSQFMLMCVSTNSRYDRVARYEGEQLTADEQTGRIIFKQRCASCHATDLFTDKKYHRNGLPPGLSNDSGRYLVTRNPADIFLFKTPSLRNVAKTAPYMHDGRFNTLQQVLTHYNSTGIAITEGEKPKIIAFLNTLTDSVFLTDPKLAKP